MKLFTKTFGCQMNVADSNEMNGHLLRHGVVHSSQEDADIVLLNTCTVRQHAEDKALSYIGRLKAWKSMKENRKIIVAGCAAERDGKSDDSAGRVGSRRGVVCAARHMRRGESISGVA